ncbi:MAG TPA: LuxR family transcriptional regulator [Stellaceae bacterium]|nr:LuxR family transcriptional regulator [Stellaceae bacterium]
MLALAFQDFIDRLERARDEDGLRSAMSIISDALGFTGFAYVGCTDPFGEIPRYVTSYPGTWVQHYVDRRYDQIDPVLAHARNSVMPFLWGDQTGGRCTSRDHPQLFDEARQFGIICGFSVPIHDSRGAVTSLTFAADRKPEVLARTVDVHHHILHLAALYFDVHAGRKLGAAIDGGGPRLGRPELASLQWIAWGKSMREIGEILGVSRADVASHLSAARRNLGAATLSQAVAVAFKHKLIEY